MACAYGRLIFSVYEERPQRGHRTCIIVSSRKLSTGFSADASFYRCPLAPIIIADSSIDGLYGTESVVTSRAYSIGYREPRE